MKKILIVYESKTGQTRKIAECIKEELQKDGCTVDALDTHTDSPVDVESYNGVIVGGPVYASHYPRALKSWVKKNADKLSKVPGAFFSVCLGILERDNPKVQADEKRIVEKLLTSSGWNPRMTKIFPGILAYTKYGWFKKFFMKKIAGKAGGSTDTSKDHEYTDWTEVRQFAHQFSYSLGM